MRLDAKVDKFATDTAANMDRISRDNDRISREVATLSKHVAEIDTPKFDQFWNTPTQHKQWP